MKLEQFQVETAPKSGIRVSLKGEALYIAILQQAFRKAQWYGPYGSFKKAFDHVLYVHNLAQDELRDFLDFCEDTLLLVSTLDECWAMDYHTTVRLGLRMRTEIGELVYRAKTYKGLFGTPKLGSREKADELGDLMGQRFSRHPRIRRADRILGVPANPPKKPHNLPEVLAERIGRACGVMFDSDLVIKTRPTSEMKDRVRDEERLEEIRGAYEVRGRVDGESIVLVDDLLMAGSTLSVVSQVLRESGASEVLGIVATKTLRA